MVLMGSPYKISRVAVPARQKLQMRKRTPKSARPDAANFQWLHTRSPDGLVSSALLSLWRADLVGGIARSEALNYCNRRHD
jgi:hypothetical protein